MERVSAGKDNSSAENWRKDHPSYKEATAFTDRENKGTLLGVSMRRTKNKI